MLADFDAYVKAWENTSPMQIVVAGITRALHNTAKTLVSSRLIELSGVHGKIFGTCKDLRLGFGALTSVGERGDLDMSKGNVLQCYLQGRTEVTQVLS